MMGSLSAANAKFCLDFFKELSKVKRNENTFFSLLSISAALSMVQLGAGGNTAEELEKVSFLPFSWELLLEAYIWKWKRGRSLLAVWAMFFTNSELKEVAATGLKALLSKHAHLTCGACEASVQPQCVLCVFINLFTKIYIAFISQVLHTYEVLRMASPGTKSTTGKVR